MKKLIQLKLKILAKTILRKYNPRIVGITGSVGKTSTKEAVFNVLSSKFNTRESIKNYNNELGVPLSIIGIKSPGKSLFGWFFVFFKALKLILLKDKDYPEFLVLEFGVDRPGDMEYLISIAKCDIGVITTIGSSHLEFFKTVKNIQKEKSVLIKELKREGWAILNYDDELTKELKSAAKTKILTYGFHSEANVRAQNLVFSFEENRDIDNMSGVSFKLNHEGSVVPIKLPRVIGYSAIYSSLAAASVGIAYKMNLVEISDALRNYYLPYGRMNLIKGIKNTLIIDDSYNSSPQSSISAIDFIKKIDLENKGRKWAVLGDMMELGSYTEEGHREVGRALY
ncbi:UDP-N-acetylmuramoyl-tripeptide--D-alanyl-D-alanine ligase, partial [bacterium]|nr:UDP-N-acetylmuramoyl-tripeptide--D-alanyl-D-alanine ligase [bacterium]